MGLCTKNDINQKFWAYYWDTCGRPVIKCLCVLGVFFLRHKMEKLRNSTQWSLGLNTMTTNCDPMRCSHADHACYLDDD